MTSNWQVTSELDDLLARAIEQAGFADQLATHLPSIMWTEGGRAEAPGKPTIPIPPHYGVGPVRIENVSRVSTINSAKFGHIVFHPAPSDAASIRRIVDYDGKDIIVR
jgi:hypothetical protein